jgi:hypothetical protein
MPGAFRPSELPEMVERTLSAPAWSTGGKQPRRFPPMSNSTQAIIECHETLETLGRRCAIRDLYWGVLQVGVAFHHLKRTTDGAMKMFRQLPKPGLSVPGVQVAALSRRPNVYDEMVALGPDVDNWTWFLLDR